MFGPGKAVTTANAILLYQLKLMADLDAYLALQTVLHASRDPVIDELRATVARQAKELQELGDKHAKELQELRDTVASLEDMVDDLEDVADEMGEVTHDRDQMRDFIRDVHQGIQRFVNESMSPEQKGAYEGGGILWILRVAAEQWLS